MPSCCAGYSPDIKNVFQQLNVGAIDSAGQGNWASVFQRQYKPVVKSNVVSANKMPDVKNMTLKDALYILENMNIKVVAKGRGKVVAQDVFPGATINKKQTVTLLLN